MSGRRHPPSVARALSERARAAEAPAQGAAPGHVLDGIRGLIDGLQKLAETAQDMRGEMGGQDGKIVFGCSIRTADGAVQSFGTPARGAAPEAREPLTDVMEEADAILVVAEVPGLDPAQLSLSVTDGALLIEGGGRVRYRRRVALPAAVDAARLTQACRNGILEVRLPRAGAGGGA